MQANDGSNYFGYILHGGNQTVTQEYLEKAYHWKSKMEKSQITECIKQQIKKASKPFYKIVLN